MGKWQSKSPPPLDGSDASERDRVGLGPRPEGPRGLLTSAADIVLPRFEPAEFGEYILQDRIGSGGMAEIFLATSRGIEGFEKRLVIKRILPTLSDDVQFVRMFIEEAKLCVALKHPNIVQVYDLGEIDHQYYIAMEWVDGRDLLKTLAACGRKRIGFPTDIALYIVMEVLQGLDHAHSLTRPTGQPLGIIHRDVSPSNVLLSFEGEVKIGDFGIAKASTREKTATGILKGKFGYMAPEQVTGALIDHRADVFAAGIVLFELLTGHRLFAGKNDLAVLERVRDAIIDPPPRHFRPDLDPDLEAIVLGALARRPEDRFQSARELHDALHAYVYRSRAQVGPAHLARFMQNLFLHDPEEQARRARVRLPPVEPPSPNAFRRPSPPEKSLRSEERTSISVVEAPSMVTVPVEEPSETDEEEATAIRAPTDRSGSSTVTNPRDAAPQNLEGDQEDHVQKTGFSPAEIVERARPPSEGTEVRTAESLIAAGDTIMEPPSDRTLHDDGEETMVGLDESERAALLKSLQDGEDAVHPATYRDQGPLPPLEDPYGDLAATDARLDAPDDPLDLNEGGGRTDPDGPRISIAAPRIETPVEEPDPPAETSAEPGSPGEAAAPVPETFEEPLLSKVALRGPPPEAETDVGPTDLPTARVSAGELEGLRAHFEPQVFEAAPPGGRDQPFADEAEDRTAALIGPPEAVVAPVSDGPPDLETKAVASFELAGFDALEASSAAAPRSVSGGDLEPTVDGMDPPDPANRSRSWASYVTAVPSPRGDSVLNRAEASDPAASPARTPSVTLGSNREAERGLGGFSEAPHDPPSWDRPSTGTASTEGEVWSALEESEAVRQRVDALRARRPTGRDLTTFGELVDDDGEQTVGLEAPSEAERPAPTFEEEELSAPALTSAGALLDEGAADLFGVLSVLDEDEGSASTFHPDDEPSGETESRPVEPTLFRSKNEDVDVEYGHTRLGALTGDAPVFVGGVRSAPPTGERQGSATVDAFDVSGLGEAELHLKPGFASSPTNEPTGEAVLDDTGFFEKRSPRGRLVSSSFELDTGEAVMASPLEARGGPGARARSVNPRQQEALRRVVERIRPAKEMNRARHVETRTGPLDYDEPPLVSPAREKKSAPPPPRPIPRPIGRTLTMVLAGASALAAALATGLLVTMLSTSKEERPDQTEIPPMLEGEGPRPASLDDEALAPLPRTAPVVDAESLGEDPEDKPGWPAERPESSGKDETPNASGPSSGKKQGRLFVSCARPVDLHVRGIGRFPVRPPGFERGFAPGGYVVTLVRDGRIIDRRSVRLRPGRTVELSCP